MCSKLRDEMLISRTPALLAWYPHYATQECLRPRQAANLKAKNGKTRGQAKKLLLLFTTEF